MKIYPTCSLCCHFDPNRKICKVKQISVDAMEQELPQECKKEGNFLRDMNVLLDSYHFYRKDEEVPADWRMDLSKLPKDDRGIPLFVMTKRGVERAIPVDPSIPLKGDKLLGVKKVYTYQGQRELIYDLGVKLAKEIADKHGVPLHILPGEENSQGIEREIQKHYIYLNRRNRIVSQPSKVWEWDETEERW